MQLRSPNELMEAASREMLKGKKPETHEEWIMVFNFLAFHIAPVAQPSALLIFRMIYDAPLTEEEIQAISKFQIATKETR